MYNIYLTGGDDANWALDTELRLAKDALSSFAKIVDSPADADFYHTVDINQTVDAIKNHQIAISIPVVGPINNHPTRLTELPGFIKTARNVVLVPQSKIAQDDMDRLGLAYPQRTILAADSTSYFPIDRSDTGLIQYRESIGLPQDSYIIGLFQRDSDGKDLTRIKIQKGADIFLALMLRLKKSVSKDKFHVLLGGPRRHWLRRQLERHGVRTTFVGKEIEEDDYPENILGPEEMCRLYNLLDLYVIPTRWEGAPRQLFDVICCRKKIISTPVGIVPEVLDPRCVFHNLREGVRLIEQDIESDLLGTVIGRHESIVRSRFTVDEVGRSWEVIYTELGKNYYPDGINGLVRIKSRLDQRITGIKNFYYHFTRRLKRMGGGIKVPDDLRICTCKCASGSNYLPLVRALLQDNGLVLEDGFDGTNLVCLFNDAGKAAGWNSSSVGVHFLDESFSGLLASGDYSARQRLLKIQKRVSATVLSSDYCLADLSGQNIDLVNPVVVQIPPLWKVAGPTESRTITVFSSRTDHSLDGYLAIIQSMDLEVHLVDDWSAQQAALLEDNPEVVVIFPSFRDSLILQQYLQQGCPVVLHKEASRYRDTVGFAGLSFSDGESLLDSLREVTTHRAVYQAAISLPYRDEAFDTLMQVFRSALEYGG